MVALLLSVVSLVVVSLVPRSHLYWSGYETTCLRRSALLKHCKRVVSQATRHYFGETCHLWVPQ